MGCAADHPLITTYHFVSCCNSRVFDVAAVHPLRDGDICLWLLRVRVDVGKSAWMPDRAMRSCLANRDNFNGGSCSVLANDGLHRYGQRAAVGESVLHQVGQLRTRPYDGAARSGCHSLAVRSSRCRCGLRPPRRVLCGSCLHHRRRWDCALERRLCCDVHHQVDLQTVPRFTCP